MITDLGLDLPTSVVYKDPAFLFAFKCNSSKTGSLARVTATDGSEALSLSCACLLRCQSYVSKARHFSYKGNMSMEDKSLTMLRKMPGIILVVQ
jgi:hypothetical protein